MSEQDRDESESADDDAAEQPEREAAGDDDEAGDEPENGGHETSVGSGPDSEPSPVPMPVVQAGPAPLPRGGKLLLQLALPVVAVGAAVGVHWAVNVPKEIVSSNKDQGAEKKKNKDRGRDKRAKKAAPKEEPRTAEELDEVWARWQEREFDDEPVLARWARRHQAVISKVFVEARRVTFEGAEEPGATLVRPKCRTVRCRFVVRSPFPHELDLMDQALAQLQVDGADLWRSYVAERIEPPEGQPEEQRYMQVTVAFNADDPDPEALTVQGRPKVGDDEQLDPDVEPEEAEPDDDDNEDDDKG